MKKYIIILFLLMILGIIRFFIVHIDVETKKMEVRYFYKDKRILKEIRKEDIEDIRLIINGWKIREIGQPSCGFTQDIALYIDNNIFCIACDGCGKIYYKEKNIYYSISEKDNYRLKKILKKYGLRFPCI